MTALSFAVAALCIVLLAAMAMTPAEPPAEEEDTSRGTAPG